MKMLASGTEECQGRNLNKGIYLLEQLLVVRYTDWRNAVQEGSPFPIPC